MIELGRTELHDARGNRYVLAFDADATAVLRNRVVVVVKATRIAAETGEETQVEAKVTLDVTERLVTVEFDDIEPFVLHLGGSAPLDDDDQDFNDPAEMVDLLSRLLRDGGAADRLADFVDYIPAGEPGLGCLLKAGVATTLAQMVKCHGLQPHIGTIGREVWAILRCLGVHSHVMLAKATLRTLRCWASFGLL